MDDAARQLKEDRQLRALFQEAGRHQAPVGLADAVLSRAQLGVRQEAPLLPRIGWWTGGSVVALLLLAWLSQGQASATSLVPATVLEFLGSPWITAALAITVLLGALDLFLARRSGAVLPG